MNIGIPKERRPFEFRVGMTPTGVQMLVQQGHTCYVEHNAGLGAGFSDQEYDRAGARIVYSAHEVVGRADLLLKVARPLYEELEWLRPGVTIAGLLHLASARQDKINILLEKEITAISYEQIMLVDGIYPVRRPLSQIGGKLIAQISARLLQNDFGGKGIYLGGVASVPPAEVIIIGAGVFGTYTAQSFVGMGAKVTAMDINITALQRIQEHLPSVITAMAYPQNIASACSHADVVVSAVMVSGELAPRVITREMVQGMKERSLIVDASIDEGGSVETSRPTTHEHPTFIEEGVIHYCVPNIPSVVARTSSYAYLNAAFPYIMEIANNGVDQAVTENSAIDRGTVIMHGSIRHMPRMKPPEDGE
jgi:alanine dehydrogenase